MRKRYCAFIGIAVGILLLQPNRPQATTFLTIAPDASGSSCYVADPGPNQLVTMYVVAKFSAGSTAFQFSAPVSPTSGLTFVGDQSQYYMVGSSQTTAVVSLDMCTTGTFSVVQMLFYRPASVATCAFCTVQPGAIESDCAFAEHTVNAGGTMVNSDGTCSQAKHVSPADGAVNIPLTTALSWIPGYTCELSTGLQIFFGTAPNPPLIATDGPNPHPVGPLQPNTKYYWRVADPGAGPVWSFTTAYTVATQPTTWGSIKALYR